MPDQGAYEYIEQLANMVGATGRPECGGISDVDVELLLEIPL